MSETSNNLYPYFCMMFASCNTGKSRTIILCVFGIFLFPGLYAQYSYKQDIFLNKLQNFKDTSEEHNFYGCISNCRWLVRHQPREPAVGGVSTAHMQVQQSDNSKCTHFYPYNKKRVKLAALANVAGFGSMLIGLNEAWYSQYPKSGFHFFNDFAEWQQVDKVGHAFSTYSGSRASMELWRWAGLPRKQRIWIGGLSGIAYGSVIETLDGFSSEYGFSLTDYAANIIGSGMFIAQELAWDDQRIKLKFSFHKKNYGEAGLNARADKIYGKTETERFIKDYNAQTYWLSANIHSFFPESKLPRWLSLSAGYGADGMFGARSNIAVDKTGTVVFDRSDIKRYRQWYLAPDIDLTKIKTDKKSLKIIFFILSTLKFPTPALEFSNGSFKGHWVVF